MTYRYDGSVESINLPTLEHQRGIKDYGLYRCMIVGVQYSDDAANIFKNSQNPQVLYEAMILGGFKEGQIISNVRLASNLGGKYNYSERVLRKTSKSLTKIKLSEHDGDIVFIEFNRGDPNFPVIVMCGTNTLDKTATGATKSDGPRWLEQYNGVIRKINKTGEFELTRKGGAYDETKDYFIPVDGDENQASVVSSSSTFESTFQLFDNTVTLADQQASIQFKQAEKTCEHKVGRSAIDLTSSAVYKETIDATAKTCTKVWDSGLTVTENASSDIITIKTAGSAEIKLSAATIALGAGSTELLQQIVNSLDKLITWANNTGATHTHLGNLGFPTAPPTQAANYTQLGTDLTTIKGLLNGIKGSL